MGYLYTSRTPTTVNVGSYVISETGISLDEAVDALDTCIDILRTSLDTAVEVVAPVEVIAPVEVVVPPVEVPPVL